jgi:Tfp pilus assembly protein PilN
MKPQCKSNTLNLFLQDLETELAGAQQDAGNCLVQLTAKKEEANRVQDQLTQAQQELASAVAKTQQLTKDKDSLAGELEACKVKSAEPAKDNAAAGKRP